MKKHIYLCFLLLTILFAGCAVPEEGKAEEAEKTIEYEFTGDEIVVILSQNHPEGEMPSYDGVLLVYSDGRVEAGIVDLLEVLVDKVYDKEIQKYFFHHKELAVLEEETLEELLLLTQSFQMDCGWEKNSEKEYSDVVATEKYSYYCMQWSEEGGDKLMVINGDNQRGTIKAANDEQACFAIRLVREGEYMEEWYDYVNLWLN